MADATRERSGSRSLRTPGRHASCDDRDDPGARRSRSRGAVQKRQTSPTFPVTQERELEARRDREKRQRESRHRTPVQSVAAPVQSVAAPVQSVAAPVQSVAAPVQSVAAPVQSVATLGQSVAATARAIAVPAFGVGTPASAVAASVSAAIAAPARDSILTIKGQRMDIWLRKVNECATVYGWDERTTVHFAMQKLQGLAKVWYEGLNSILYTWAEWQVKLKSAFPCEQNYGQILEEMLKRKTKFGEPIENYFYEKLAPINQCDISGKRAVDCIVHGITDRNIKTSALALNCSEPDQILQFLISNKEVQSVDRNLNRNKSWGDSGSQNSKSNLNKPPQFSGHIFCFNCKERGHSYLQCPKPLLKCTSCNKIGHVTENCRTKPKDTAAKNEPSKTMCISSLSPNAKYYKQIKVNDVKVDALIDFGSEVTLVRESLANNLGLMHDQKPLPMTGFGKKIVYSLGSVMLKLEVDEVEASVECRVVNDLYLEKQILVGQSFTELRHITVYKDYKSLEFRRLSTELPTVDNDIEDHRLIEIKVAADVELFGPASIRACIGTDVSGCVLLNNGVIGSPLHETREDEDLAAIRTQVKNKIDQEQEKQKQRYDRKRKPARIYNERDLVKITKVSFNNDGKSKKLLPSFIGPFRVKKVLGQDRYQITSVPGFNGNTNKRITTVAADRMMPWVHIAALELNDDTDSNKSSESDDEL
ncbi:hypothetical protein NE865_09206 [Phthorimaea operculella]|nr:hypothetical protein NE865_09206 [Phthorimaea operculella]